MPVLENHLLGSETCQASDLSKVAGESAKRHVLYDFSDEQVTIEVLMFYFPFLFFNKNYRAYFAKGLHQILRVRLKFTWDSIEIVVLALIIVMV